MYQLLFVFTVKVEVDEESLSPEEQKEWKIMKLLLNSLTPELNPSEQRCLQEFFTGAFKF